jgi:hypothetical protein
MRRQAKPQELRPGIPRSEQRGQLRSSPKGAPGFEAFLLLRLPNVTLSHGLHDLDELALSVRAPPTLSLQVGVCDSVQNCHPRVYFL